MKMYELFLLKINLMSIMFYIIMVDCMMCVHCYQEEIHCTHLIKVISTFITEMKRLNDYNYVWFGSYQKMFGNKFMDLVYEFVEVSQKKGRIKPQITLLKHDFHY